MTLADDLRSSFKRGDILIRLIYVNVAVFVAVGLVFLVFRLITPDMSLNQLRLWYNNKVLIYLMVPSMPAELVRRPWTLVTYMFTHFNLWHILFNMLVFFWFGKIFLQYLTGRQLLTTYLIGGLCGALLYLIFLNGIPGLREHLGSYMLGASASIMAIVVAISFYAPDYTLYLLFIGPVKLKYIALFYVVMDVLMIASYNAGGHIAHLGGALYGYWFISRFKKGKDTGRWLDSLLEKLTALFRPNPHMSVSYRKNARFMNDEDYNQSKAYQQKEVDRILDKIAKGGYESLTKEEKETLFNMSNKDK